MNQVDPDNGDNLSLDEDSDSESDSINHSINAIQEESV